MICLSGGTETVPVRAPVDAGNQGRLPGLTDSRRKKDHGLSSM